MMCPFCRIHMFDNWSVETFIRFGQYIPLNYRTAICPKCNGVIVEIGQCETFRMVQPISSNRGPIPVEVPPHIGQDYTEACNVLALSAKASAALSRRCLQATLRDQGYLSSNLATQIDSILNENDPQKAIPKSLREAIDGIR